VQVLLVVDEQPVGALGSYGAYEPLHVGVGPSRRMHPMLLMRDELCG
jgi:hypothetical protein